MTLERLDAQLEELHSDPMKQLISNVRVKNIEVGGKFAVEFGRGRSAVIVFPTPSTRQIGSYHASEFLALPLYGESKLISVQHWGVTGLTPDVVSMLIRQRLGVRPQLFDAGGGYNNDKLTLKMRNYSIGPKYTECSDGGSVFYKNCTLVEASEDRIEAIFDANIQRIKGMQAVAQKMSAALT